MMTFEKKYEKRPGDGAAFVNVDKTEAWAFAYYQPQKGISESSDLNIGVTVAFGLSP